MARRGADTPARRLRRHGVRVSAGPWTICAEKAQADGGRLILALGRVAGGAVTRSRVRRIARQVLAEACCSPPGVDLLLLARSPVSHQPRSQVRASLAELLRRLLVAMSRRDAHGRRHDQTL